MIDVFILRIFCMHIATLYQWTRHTSNFRFLSMSEKYTGVTFVTICNERIGQRLDNFLLCHLKRLPRSKIYKLIRKGEVRVNKKRAKPEQRLNEGDLVRIPPVTLPEETDVTVPEQILQKLQHAIVFEDKKFIVLDKPAGIAVHGGSGLSFGVIEGLRKLFDNPKLELVHRLDKETSGCLLIAKQRQALLLAHEALRKNQAKKRYIALLENTWQGKRQRIIDIPLKKNLLAGGERMVEPSKDGKSAKTMFQLIKNFPDCCLVHAYPVTGRTHQIRVHAQYMGQAIIGDKKYGSKKTKIKSPRLFLHANQLNFSEELAPYFFDVPPNEQWQSFINNLSLI